MKFVKSTHVAVSIVEPNKHFSFSIEEAEEKLRKILEKIKENNDWVRYYIRVFENNSVINVNILGTNSTVLKMLMGRLQEEASMMGITIEYQLRRMGKRR